MKEKRVVVYEYMSNRSFPECLFSKIDLGLNWRKRFRIVLDVAKALAFLHLECDPPVIHGELVMLSPTICCSILNFVPRFLIF